MANLSTRIRKLEALVIPANLLAPGSEEWLAFWSDKVERLVAGEEPDRIGRTPIEVIDQMRALPRREAT
jgi:hypothetical protein